MRKKISRCPQQAFTSQQIHRPFDLSIAFEGCSGRLFHRVSDAWSLPLAGTTSSS